MEKQKEFIASQKTLLQHELGQCKTEAQKKTVKEQYRPSTLRDLKMGEIVGGVVKMLEIYLMK